MEFSQEVKKNIIDKVFINFIARHTKLKKIIFIEQYFVDLS